MIIRVCVCVCRLSARCPSSVLGSWTDDPLKHTHAHTHTHTGSSWWVVQHRSVGRFRPNTLWLWMNRKLCVCVNTAEQSSRSWRTHARTHTHTHTHTHSAGSPELKQQAGYQSPAVGPGARCGSLTDPQTESHSRPDVSNGDRDLTPRRRG